MERINRRYAKVSYPGSEPEPVALAEPEGCAESLRDRVNRAKARWLKRVMYNAQATSTEKCFAYAIADHLNCVTLDSWPSQTRLIQLLGCVSTKTPKRAASRLELMGILTVNRKSREYLRYAPVFLPGDEDKHVQTSAHPRPQSRDAYVRESLLGIHLTTSPSTEGAAERRRPIRTYDPRRRGATEIKLIPLLGNDGLEILAKLERFDSRVVDRMCQAFECGAFGEKEAAAARLAAEQMGRSRQHAR